MSNRMPIPKVREELDAASLELAALAGQVADLASRVSRLSEATKRAPRTRPTADPDGSAALTEELAAEIVAYANANPRTSQHRIAAKFNVNQGRVSIVLAGR